MEYFPFLTVTPNRYRKFKALQFLVRARLVSVDRSDPENPLVTIAWESRYLPETTP